MTKKHQIRHVISAVHETPWAITPEMLDTIGDLIERRAEGHLSEAEIEERMQGVRRRYLVEEEEERPYQVHDGVAVIPLYGVLGPRMNLMMRYSGGTSSQEFAAAVDQAIEDNEVRAIVLDIDSPGGSVLGTPEAAERVHLAAQKKTVVAVGTGMMCSAAYYIGAAAGQVVCTRSTKTASIGVLSLHSDYSAMETTAGIRRTVIRAGSKKVRANPHETLNDEGRATLQQQANDYYDMFVTDVARYRGVSVETVLAEFGAGEPMLAAKAQTAGVIDRIGTLSEIIAELGQDQPAPQASTSLPQETNMNELMTALRRRNLISDGDNKQAALAAVRGWYAARKEDVPTGEDDQIDAEQVVKDLEAADQTEPEKPAPPAPQGAGEQENRGAGEETPAPQPQTETQTPDQIAAAERYRIGEIQAIGEMFGLDESAIDAAVDGGTTVEAFIQEARKTMPKNNGPVGRIEGGQASEDKFRAYAVEALARRGGIDLEGDQSQGASELQYMSLLDIGRRSLQVGGCRDITGMNDQIAKAILGDREAMHEIGAADRPMHGPGSFPNILSGLASQVLEAAPRYADTTFQFWANKRPERPGPPAARP